MLLVILAKLRKYWPEVAVWLLVACVVVWWAWCRPKPAPVPVAEQRTRDSLSITLPGYQALQQQLVQKETVYVQRAAREEHTATTDRRIADSLSLVADTLTKQAEPDTLSKWFHVAQVRTAEADSLKVANDSLAASNRAKDTVIAAANSAATAATQRMTAVENLNDRLARDVRIAGQCHVLPFISCPSRKASFVVGAALAAAGSVYLLRR